VNAGTPASLPDVRADALVHTWLMATQRVSWLLIIAGCTLPLADGGCNGKASSSDAAGVAPTSTGGAARDGSLGMGGGSAGRDGSVTANGGAGGSGGIASSGGATGLGGKRDGGDVDAPGTIGTGGASGLDAGVDGGTESACVGTPSNLYCPASETNCYTVLGCHLQVPTTGHCLGSAHACSYNTTPTSCAAQSGCVWSVDAGSSAGCGGTATECNYDTARDRCEAAGCQYLINGQYCTGTPTPCSQLSTANCTRQPGCALGAT
jgi:hypothetical protein